MDMKRYIAPLLIALLAVNATAQTSLSLYHMEVIPQSSLLNPARAPRCNVFVGMPSTNISLRGETNMKMSEMFQKVNGQWKFMTESDFDYSDINHRIKKGIHANAQMNIGLINVGWRQAENYWTVNWNARASSGITMPKAFLTMLDKGLPDGSHLDFSRLKVNFISYHELSVGYTRAIDEQLSVGGRLKYLSGVFAAKTKFSKFELTTSREQWTFDVDGEADLAFPLKMTPDQNGAIATDSIEWKEMTAAEIVGRTLIGFHNPGAAIDLGAEYKIDENFKVSASVTDLGFIVWSKDASKLHAENKYEYNGFEVEFNDFFDGINLSDKFGDVVDSVKNAFSSHTSDKNFVTGVHPNIYVGGEFTPYRFMSVGLVSRTTFWGKGVTQNFNLTLNMKPYSFVSVMSGYSIDLKGCLTTDFGFSINMGPLQYYLMLDGIPLAYRHLNLEGDRFMVPYNLCDLSVNTGFNIIIGAKGPKPNHNSKY